MALIGGFTPRRCGIATFTVDTRRSLMDADAELIVDVYAMTPADGAISFDSAVRGTICESDAQSYLAAAEQIASSKADMVWLQHEFGLFGGPAGDLVLELVNRIAVPLIITLHTVLAEPEPAQMAVMQRLVARASKLVVMSQEARLLLARVYGASDDQIVLIAHGVPDRPFGRAQAFKEKFGLAGRQVLMTFGLLSPGKGIEAVIAALPAIISDHPQALYCIVGATHPNLLAREGEAYRERLHELARSLGVEDHIHWTDAFLATRELLDLIEAADIYVTPYPGAAQSTSGTLSYAVALGKAVVSTPYVHAKELLADDLGILVPFNDSAAIAQEVNSLLGKPDALLALQRRAYAKGREMIWPEFAARCRDVIEDVRIPEPALSGHTRIGLSGLLRICDDTGILQHSIFGVPDRAHGYCVDDNARALMLMNRLGDHAEPHRSRMAMTFAAFVQSAWNPDRAEFRNFMGFRREWLEEVGSEDSCGRTLWALGATANESHLPALRHWARGLFDQTCPSALGFSSPRAAAFAMLGADYLLETDPAHELATTILGEGADTLLGLFEQVRRADWPWFETRLAYDNCRLSEAMLRAGDRLGREDFTQCGIATLDWLMIMQTAPDGHFRPIGSDSFGRDFADPQPFDQQPVEIWAAMDACKAAFDATNDPGWLAEARRAYDWFGGRNDRGVIVGDPQSGTCHDGINPRGLNLNEGAESVLAYQLATCALRQMTHG
jgi:glycosyltransferase involved in cell wall biosynthesis